MDTANAVALYGAGLSTALAATQGWSAWRRRTNVSVSAEVMYSAGESVYGTPVPVERGDDIHPESVVIAFEIRNFGGRPVQVLGLLIESLHRESEVLDSRQITPSGLPVVLEPGTTAEALLQKEHLDFLESCTFIGVVDGMGRRQGMPSEQASAILARCWQLPTRVGVYQRRDDPSKRAVAFQLADSAKMTSRPDDRRFGRRGRVIAERPRPLMETLMSGEQSHANRPSGHYGIEAHEGE